MGKNYKVPFKSEETIADFAARCWAISSQQRPLTFGVVEFIKSVLVEEGIDAVVTTRGRKKGKLAIKYFDREFPQDDPAYVEFARDQRDNYVTLNVDREIWRRAEFGDSDACEILAHEIGHILLHDHFANAFSSDKDGQKLFAGTSKEDFAEWQAITFAGHLLIPTRVARRYSNSQILSAVTNSPERLAKERLAAILNEKKILDRSYEGEMCGVCGGFTLVREGRRLTCDNCGTSSES
jgi:Zn-dependent peptidase ImmA (M78 family)